MKVLYVAPEYPNDNLTAAQVRANEVLPVLESLLDLRVIGYKPKASVGKTSINPERILLGDIRDNKVGLLLSTFGDMPRSFYRYGGAGNSQLLRQLLYDFEPDVIHLDSAATMVHLPLCLEYRTKRNIKVVLQPHDSLTRIYERQWQSAKTTALKADRFLQWRKYKRFECSQYAMADLCLVDTERDAELLRELDIRTTVRVLPLGFNPSHYRPEGPKADIESKSLVFSGTMSSVQSVAAAEELINIIMPQVWEKHPDCHLYLVGSNPSETILQLAKTDPRTHVTGFVDDMSSYLRSCSLFVCPLRLGSGMRTRTVEALATGCAIVSYPDGVEGLGDENNAPWLLASTVQEFQTIVIDMLNNPDAALGLGKRAANYVENKYTWASVASQLHEMYRTVCNQRPK